jgi:hypothetical protein
MAITGIAGAKRIPEIRFTWFLSAFMLPVSDSTTVDERPEKFNVENPVNDEFTRRVAVGVERLIIYVVGFRYALPDLPTAKRKVTMMSLSIQYGKASRGMQGRAALLHFVPTRLET